MLSFSSTSTRGKTLVRDINNYEYKLNTTSKTTKYWICREKGCKARIQTKISTNDHIGDNLPEHHHENHCLKRTAEQTEYKIIKQMAQNNGK